MGRVFWSGRSGLAVTIAGLLIAVGSVPRVADAQQTGGRPDAFSRQTSLLDNRLSSQYGHSDRLAPARTPGRLDETIPTYSSRGGRYEGPARAAARRHGIPEALFLRLVQRESNWNPAAVSHKGALGLAQLMPGTARRLGVDPADPLENLDGGARYLARQFRRFGTWRLALAAYNAGPGAVERHHGVPPYKETVAYVAAILEAR